MKAEIFSIGTELLMGELTDTNTAWLAARLPALGIELQWVSIIGDNLAGSPAPCNALISSSPRAAWDQPRTI